MSHLPAVILLSGGLDSATTLALAKAEGFEPYAISFRYGQRHAVELKAARGSHPRSAWPGTSRPRSICASSADRRSPPISTCQSTTASTSWTMASRHLRSCTQHDLPVVRAGLGRDSRRQRHLHRRQRARLQRLPGLPPGVHRRVRDDGQPGDQGRRRGPAASTDPYAADHAVQGGDHPARARTGRRLRADPQLLRPRR